MDLSTTAAVKIEAHQISKNFGAHYIIRNFTETFVTGSATAISGPNGSGKSTLLRLLSGQLLQSEGKLSFSESGIEISSDEIYKYISLCGPYLELIEELSGIESIVLHQRLRGFRQNISQEVIWQRIGWTKAVQKQAVSSYSSGMKQRLRLAITLASQGSVLMLDEPTSNLDAEGVAWYTQLVQDWADKRTVLIASNEERDFIDCTRLISADAWQHKR